MEKKGKDIYITSKARQLLGLVPEDLKKPELTASWELKLGKIARGELKQEAFLSSIRGYTEELISEIKTADGTFRHENITARNARAAANFFWQSTERTVSFWSARTGSAATGRPFPGPPTPAARTATRRWR